MSGPPRANAPAEIIIPFEPIITSPGPENNSQAARGEKFLKIFFGYYAASILFWPRVRRKISRILPDAPCRFWDGRGEIRLLKGEIIWLR